MLDPLSLSFKVFKVKLVVVRTFWTLKEYIFYITGQSAIERW